MVATSPCSVEFLGRGRKTVLKIESNSFTKISDVHSRPGSPIFSRSGGRGMESTRLVGMKRKDEKLFLDRLNKATKRDSFTGTFAPSSNQCCRLF